MLPFQPLLYIDTTLNPFTDETEPNREIKSRQNLRPRWKVTAPVPVLSPQAVFNHGEAMSGEALALIRCHIHAVILHHANLTRTKPDVHLSTGVNTRRSETLPPCHVLDVLIIDFPNEIGQA